ILFYLSKIKHNTFFYIVYIYFSIICLYLFMYIYIFMLINSWFIDINLYLLDFRPNINYYLFLSITRISLPFIILILFIFPIIVLNSVKQIKINVKLDNFLLLLMEFLSILLFLVQDLFSFLFFYEVLMIPLFFYIGI